MAIKRFFRRKRKGRGDAKSAQPFIQAESAQHEGGEGNSFFLPREVEVQAKTKVSEAGDEQEREADKAADRAVRHKQEEEKQLRQKKEAEKRMRHKPEKEKHHAEKDKHKPEKEKPLHYHMEEEKLQRKEGKGAGSPAGPANVAARAGSVGAASGEGGNQLSSGVLHEMSGSLGYDFSTVKIHTDREAQEMSEQLGAQAFTHGADIYFNSGKYDPQSQEGKWLLAHELAHVAQQRGGPAGSSGAEPVIQRKPVAGISTPVPDKFGVKMKKQVVLSASGQVKGVWVEVLPDKVGIVTIRGKDAETSLKIAHSYPKPTYSGHTVQNSGVASVSLIIQTTYLKETKPEGPTKYGKGTTAADVQAGNTSIRFHEGSHGGSAIDFVLNNPVPTFQWKAGMPEADVRKTEKEFKEAITAYHDTMVKENVQVIDCVGQPDPTCKTP